MNQPSNLDARPLFVIGELPVKVKWEDAKIYLLFAKKRFPVPQKWQRIPARRAASRRAPV
jgi:hypothetical protein